MMTFDLPTIDELGMDLDGDNGCGGDCGPPTETL